VKTLHDIRMAVAHPPARLPPGRRQAAVAAILTADLDLLLMRRAEHPGDPWSGHVSFPGGRIEDHDHDSVAGAIRETSEEIGVDLGRAQLLGPLDELTTVGVPSGLVIRPFVFAIDERPALTPNREVASVHWIGLGDLLSGRGRGPFEYDHRGTLHTLPRVDFQGLRLWGLTLRMVDDLLHRLDGQGVGLDRVTPPE